MSKFFQKLVPLAFAIHAFAASFFLSYPKAFATVFEILLKTLRNTTLVHRTFDDTSHQFYPRIYVAPVTLLTYPVSACAAERSFSSMKRLFR